MTAASTRLKTTVLDGQEVVADELLVRFAGAIGTLKSKLPPGRLVPIHPSLHIYQVLLPPQQDLQAVLNAWAVVPEVLYAEPNHVQRLGPPFIIPTNPQKMATSPQFKISAFTAPWNHTNIKVPEAWTITKGSSDLVVAVIDSGIDPDQPSLKSRLLPLIDEVGSDVFTDSNQQNHDYTGRDGLGHGTHVAGIIAGDIDETNNIAGVAPNVKILPIKVISASAGFATVAQETRGIADAVQQKANVINMSLGSAFDDQTERASINDALNNGAIIVAAGGNDGGTRSLVGFPAGYPGVIAVGATTIDNKKALYSNIGTDLLVGAPGGGTDFDDSDTNLVMSTWPTYLTKDDIEAQIATAHATQGLRGTSMAAPHVTGAVALLLSQEVSLTRPQVRVRLANCVTALVSTTGFDANGVGFGQIDVQKLLNQNAP